MREEILEAALRLFVEKGYTNTSMDDVAEAVNLTKGGLYHHIEKKEDLLRQIHDQLLDSYMIRVPAAIDGIEDPIEKLSAWIRAHTMMVIDFVLHIKVFYTEIDQLSEETLKRMVERRDKVQKILQEILTSGIAAGKIHPDIDPNISSFLILGMINWIYIWYRPKGPASIEVIIENILRLLCQGLAPADRPCPEAVGTNVSPTFT